MQFEVKPDDIDSLVKTAILQSAIGKTIEGAIIKALSSGYDSPIDKEIKTLVGKITKELLEEKFTNKIKELASKVIEEKVTEALMTKLTNDAMERVVRAAERDSDY